MVFPFPRFYTNIYTGPNPRVGKDVQCRSLFILLCTVAKWYLSAHIQEEEKRELLEKESRNNIPLLSCHYGQKTPER